MKKIQFKPTGEQLNLIRKKLLGKTQAEMAKTLGCSMHLVQSMENGRRTITSERLIRLRKNAQINNGDIIAFLKEHDALTEEQRQVLDD